jgi:Protein of unknown function (DUF732)
MGGRVFAGKEAFVHTHSIRQAKVLPMTFCRKSTLAVAAVAAAIGLAAPAHADVDTDFANTLHTFGIYGQRDYNAWIAKLSCKRLDRHVDNNAHQAAAFVQGQLDRESTTEQVWKFLGLSIQTYCPQQLPVLQQAALDPAAGQPGAAEQQPS